MKPKTSVEYGLDYKLQILQNQIVITLKPHITIIIMMKILRKSL